jgi:hypothetical protein
MEHWRFFVAILLLLLLMRPIHEYFSEDDAKRFGKNISESENRIDLLNRVHYSSKLSDISKNIIDLSSNLTILTRLQIATKIAELNTKLEKLGTVQTNTATILAPSRLKNAPASYTFNLPVGTWLVTAHIVYISAEKDSPSTNDPQIGVAINPKPYDNVSGYNSIRVFDHVEFPRTVGKDTRFSVSAIVKVSEPTTNQTISVYDGNGEVKLNVISTLIGFKTI